MKISILLLLFFLISCTKQDECSDDQLPDCINEMINRAGDTPPLISVKMQTVDGECHYWLNTGANNYFEFEYIVNSQCDTVCYFGGCYPPGCSSDYPSDKWETIWTQ